MAFRQCSSCERRFNKLEHLRRHERSHTRERPYVCPVCKKHFSRSDVLFRHAKGHKPNPLIPQKQNNAPPRTQDGFPSDRVDLLAPQNNQDANQLSTPFSLNGQGLGSSPEQHRRQGSIQNLLDHDPAPAKDGNLLEGSNQPQDNSQPTFTDNELRQPDVQGSTPWTPSSVVLQKHQFNQVQEAIIAADAEMAMLPFTPPGHVSSLDAWGFDLNQNSHSIPNYLASPNRDGLSSLPPDTLQMWLLQENDLLSQSMNHNLSFEDSQIPQEKTHQTPRLAESQFSPSGSSNSIASQIPRDRFTRVERCWMPNGGKTTRLMTSLWQDLIASETDNIYADSQYARSPQEARHRRDSQWGFDEECRKRLQNAILALPPLSEWITSRANQTGQTPSPRADMVQSPGRDNIVFPPAEIFDISLEIYFANFQPMLPLIHTATFSTKQAPLPLLLVMCLLGLSILGTTGTTRFVGQVFPSVLQMVSMELHSVAGSRYTHPKQLSILATALLTLHLASVTGSRIEQTEMLYVNLISIAQCHGLFSIGRGQVPDGLLEQVTDTEAKWKAWGRIESVKHLILGLLEIDGWFTAFLAITPTVRLETVQIIPPSHKSLFTAPNSASWLRIQKTHPIYAEPLSPHPTVASLTTIQGGIPLSPSSTYTLLILLRLRIYESHHRLIVLSPPSPSNPALHLHPHLIYALDARSADLVPLTVSLSPSLPSNPTYNPQTYDLNSTVIWHNSLMMLSANIRIFELAAGRSGAGPAEEALEEIALWARTRAARRACLHAAHTFWLLQERRVNDNVSVHSVAALFQSALVLGLFIFCMPVEDGHGSEADKDGDGEEGDVVELYSEVDWSIIGNIGLREEDGYDQSNGTGADPNAGVPPSVTNSHGFPESYERGTSMAPPPPAVSASSAAMSGSTATLTNFILNGGPFSVTGIKIEPGYHSARRSLLYHADLIDGIGRWKARTFSQILHIMSDDLMDVDVDGGSEQE